MQDPQAISSASPIDVEIEKFIWLGPVPSWDTGRDCLKHTAQEPR
jgi:hypothetical protein